MAKTTKRFSLYRDVYHAKCFPRFFYKKPDGGKESGVTGYFLIEWKILFSIGILRFNKGSREAYHSHAFNAITWWLKGKVREEIFHKNPMHEAQGEYRIFTPSLKYKKTLRGHIHKIFAYEPTWALTFRGPWKNYWWEYKDNKVKKLTHGRKEL
jgi:hypothetical protein